MRPFGYILTGVLFLLAIVAAGEKLNLFPAGIFNSAQVLSVIVLNPDGSCPLSGGCGTSVSSAEVSIVGGTTASSPGAVSSGGGGGGGGAIVPATNTTATTTRVAAGSQKKGDISGDGKVNIADFSLLAYWYKRTLTAQAIASGVDLNGDGKVTLADFSILAYYWNT